MSNTTLHWQLRSILPEFRDNCRLHVLVAYLLHANVRGRAWPSTGLLCKETGYSIASVVDAKKWLVLTRALDKVPYQYRIDEEQALPPRQDIMQITGVIEIDGNRYKYLYDNAFENSEVLPSKTLPGKILLGKTEVVSSTAKDITIPKDTDIPPAPKPPKKERDPNLDHPAFQAWDKYRESGSANKLAANSIQRQAIVDAVGLDANDLNKWDCVVSQWLVKGYLLKNVTGLLDWFTTWKKIGYRAESAPWIYPMKLLAQKRAAAEKDKGAATPETIAEVQRFMKRRGESSGNQA